MWKKTIIVLLIFTLCILLGSTIMISILSTIGINPQNIQDISKITFSSEESRIFKLAFGVNHLISFILPGFLLIYFFSKNKVLSYTGINNRFDVNLFFKFIILLILSYPIYGVFVSLLNNLELPEWIRAVDDSNLSVLKQILSMDSWTDFILNFIIIAVFAGIGEELIFRGVIQKELNSVIGSSKSILISAILFSAMHFEITGFIPKLIIGLILGYSYQKTKNLIYPILIHTFNNGFQLLILYLSGNNLDKTDTSEISNTSLLGGLVFVPIIYLMIQHIHKYSVNGSNP